MTELTYRIDRATGTHADVFLAAGLADLLQQVAEGPVQLRTRDASFEVLADLPTDWPERLPTGAGYWYLQPKAQAPVPAQVPGDQVLRYEAEKARVAQYRALRQAAGPKAATDPEVMEQLQRLAPRPDWRQWQLLNLLQGDDNTNKVFLRLTEKDVGTARAAIAQGLIALQEGRPTGLPWNVSSVQLFTPNAAKGYARLKPDSTGRNDKTKEAWVDPFAEWLRYRGYFRVACPFFLDAKAERIRILTPEPADVSSEALNALAAALRGASVFGAEPRLDALAVLFLARWLIQHSELYVAAEPTAEPLVELFALVGKTPADVIGGIAITQYVSLGSARAVAQVGRLALPDWFPLATPDDTRAWLDILEEHRRIVRGLRDDRSDEVGLAIGYRRFLQQRGRPALDALLDFMGAYGAFLLRAREQRRPVSSFTTTSLRRLVGGMARREAMNDYVAILDDLGFQAVAAAVRWATVSAQNQKAQGRNDYREIRYDLLHDIRRKRSLPNPNALVETVADFVASYNYENARRREMGQRAPRNVTTQEFRAFAALVDNNDRAALVGALLAAYGSCREPREAEAVEATDGDTSAEMDVVPSDAAETAEED
jgi:hypothetical protein